MQVENRVVFQIPPMWGSCRKGHRAEVSHPQSKESVFGKTRDPQMESQSISSGLGGEHGASVTLKE